MKNLKEDFVNTTLSKIELVINCVLESYGVKMTYDLNNRNEIFCEVIKKNKKELISTEMYKSIQDALKTNSVELEKEQSEWLSSAIFEFNRDLFLLHYFYAILYSYNYDAEVQSKISMEHLQSFFEKANQIYKKYKKPIEVIDDQP